MIKMSNLLVVMLVASFLGGCSLFQTIEPIKPVKIKVSNKHVDYLKDVKPILDKRCVSCHSCYNSPCQAKFSSFEGVDRGASKLLVYDAMRLRAMNPTRLFVDADTTQEWRDKSFYSLTDTFDTNETHNDSIMMHMLYTKKMNPDVISSYKPETDKQICPKDSQEMAKYVNDKPNHGMPYGFPALKKSEYEMLTQWLAQGAHGPTDTEQKKLITPNKSAQVEID